MVAVVPPAGRQVIGRTLVCGAEGSGSNKLMD